MSMKKFVLGTVVLAMVLSACGGAITEQIIESQEGVENFDVSENDGTVVLELEDEEGDVSAVIGGGDIPADFPVPVPDGGDVMAVVSSGGDDSVSMTYPSGDFDSIKAFYENWATGFGDSLSTFSSTDAASWTVEDGDKAYSVTVANAGAEVALTILVVTTG